MSFFTPRSSVPEPPEPAQPDWIAPPIDVMGRFADLGLLLVRSDDVAIGIDGFVAYPTGVGFRLTVRGRPGRPIRWSDPFDVLYQPGRQADALLLGVELADGRRCQQDFPDVPDDGGPEPPTLIAAGGGGGGGRWDQDFWLWPLPPAGPLRFVLRWDDAGVSEQRLEVDAEPLIVAADQAIPLWPQDGR